MRRCRRCRTFDCRGDACVALIFRVIEEGDAGVAPIVKTKDMGEPPMPQSMELYPTIRPVAAVPAAVLKCDLSQAVAPAREQELLLKSAQQEGAQLVEV